MTERYVCYLVALALLLGCGSETRAPISTDTDLPRLLPEPSSIEGWSVAEGPVTYLPENLYEYLDGAAPRYLAYGFRKLMHARYEFRSDLLSSVTLNVFDMGSELGAFGIYRSGMPPGIPAQDWGAEGHRSGTVAEAWKGRVYVHAEADDDRPALIGMLEQLVVRVCGEVSGDAALPTLLESLPSNSLVPRSERYVAGDLLGHAFLPGGVMATYEVAGQESVLFFSDLGSEQLANEAVDQLYSHQSQLGVVLRDSSLMGASGFQFSDPGLGSGIVVLMKRYIAGIYGDVPSDAQERILGQLIGHLRSSDRTH